MRLTMPSETLEKTEISRISSVKTSLHKSMLVLDLLRFSFSFERFLYFHLGLSFSMLGLALFLAISSSFQFSLGTGAKLRIRDASGASITESIPFPLLL